MVADGEGVDDGGGGLDLRAQEGVEAVLPDALAVARAVEAAQAAALERIFGDVDQPRRPGTGGEEVVDHVLQARVPGAQVGHDHDVRPLSLFDWRKRSLIALRRRGRGCARLAHAVLHAPRGVFQKALRIAPSPFGEQVFHVRGQAVDDAHAQVAAVVLDVAVGGDVVEVLGGGDLGGELSGKLHPVGLDELYQAVELVRSDKGVDRVAEQDQLRLLQGGAHR